MLVRIAVFRCLETRAAVFLGPALGRGLKFSNTDPSAEKCDDRPIDDDDDVEGDDDDPG